MGLFTSEKIKTLVHHDLKRPQAVDDVKGVKNRIRVIWEGAVVVMV